MTKRSDFEWDSAKDLINQKNMGSHLLWRNSHSLIAIVLFWKILNIAKMKYDIIVSARCPTESWRYVSRTENEKSELSAPDIGAMGKRSMKRKIKYTDERMGKVRAIADFLPSPEELALKDETVKVTISLSKTSVDFFKKEAKKYNTQYQKMIRRLLDEYTAHQ